jgi:DNA helicase II / ATP-dependent DNA helicase PcrA
LAKWGTLRKGSALPETVEEPPAPAGGAPLKDLVEEYNNGLMDFDGLLINALDLLRKKKIAYKYILVDEFQDTNNLQYLLVKHLLRKDGKLFVIGDPKQSVYAFRGSNEKIFDEFKKDFPEAEEIFLDTNYRSRENIVKTSSALFGRADSLKTIKKEKGSVKLVETFNQYSEADWILKEINQKVGGIDLNFAADVDIAKQTFSFSDFAVVYRIHSLNKVLEKKFYESGMPFQIIGSKSLYQQKEIRFIILCLYYLAGFVFMYRYMNTKDQEMIVGEMREIKAVDHPVSLIKEKLKKFDKDLKVSSIVKKIVDEFQLENTLENNNIHLQNLKEFVGSTISFDRQKDGLIKFLEYISYLEEHEYYDERADKVTLMTMHAAKGLEFPFVYIIGFEDGIIPYKKSVEEGGVDEERRLLYVAMTRAENELQMVYTQKRFGKRAIVSRFARQLNASQIEQVVDEQIQKIKRRMERSKKNQLDLF